MYSFCNIFHQDDVSGVVNSMLYELFQQTEVDRFVNKFLQPFCIRKGLNLDDLIHEHVKVRILKSM